MTFDDAVALFHSLEFTPLEFETTLNIVGDNRNRSFETHFFGAIPYKFLVGKASLTQIIKTLRLKYFNKIQNKLSNE